MKNIVVFALALCLSACAPDPKQTWHSGEWVKFKKDNRRGFIMEGPSCQEGAVECKFLVFFDGYSDPVWVAEGTLYKEGE